MGYMESTGDRLGGGRQQSRETLGLGKGEMTDTCFFPEEGAGQLQSAFSSVTGRGVRALQGCLRCEGPEKGNHLGIPTLCYGRCIDSRQLVR